VSLNRTICFVNRSESSVEGIITALSTVFEVHSYSGAGALPPAAGSAQLFMLYSPVIDAESLREVQEQCTARQRPVIVITTNLEKQLRLQLLQMGVAEILDPDIEQAELLIRAQRVLEAASQKGRIVELDGHLEKLSAYFSDDVVKMILSQNDTNHDYGENLEATIFFLDIRNFTRISEGVEPNLIAALLNRLYTDIMDLILTYKGSVNKIIGDALLSTFGCPVRGERDARNAVECALAIRDTLHLFNSTRPAYIQEDISIGMGIATGRVFAGTIGSYRKRDYTVIGDTVNIAARLEGLTKQTRFDLIIDRKTRDLAGQDLKVRKLQVSRVRGRTQPMEIFLVDGLATTEAATGTDAVFFSS
jgi:adenylate cyclase